MVNLEKVSDDPKAQLAGLNAAIHKSKQNANLYYRRAVLYLKQQELEKALADADRAVKLSKSEPVYLFVKAQVLRAMKREGEALSLALQAERNGYQNAVLYVLLSDLYLRQQHYDKARHYNSLAFKLSPSDEFVLYYRGRLAAAAGDTATAVHNLRLAADQATLFFEPRRDLIGLYVSRKDFVTAQSLLKEAQKLNKEDGLLYYYQGKLYQAAEKTDSALMSYNKSVQAADTLVAAHNQLGYIHYVRGNYELAITHLEKAADAYGKTVKHLTTLASSYERTGQVDKAMATYSTLVKLEPAYTFARLRLARLRERLHPVRIDSVSVQKTENIEE